MSDQQSPASALTISMDRTGYPCIIILENECDSSLGVTIIAAGCKFLYKDGSTFQDGPIGVNIGSGGSTSFRSNDPTKCVSEVLLAITVQQQGYPNSNLTATGVCPAGQCIQQDTFTIAPKTSIDEKDLHSTSLEKRLTLRHR
jgi:hypothetical protein